MQNTPVMLLPQRPFCPWERSRCSGGAIRTKCGTLDDAGMAGRSSPSGSRTWRDELEAGGAQWRWWVLFVRWAGQRLRCPGTAAPTGFCAARRGDELRSMKPLRAALSRLLQERLKGKTIISIGHHSTLGTFHGRRIALTVNGATRARART